MRALLTDEKVLAENIVVQTAEGLDLLPSNIDLALVEFHMPAVARERVLDKKLRSLLPQYDYVLIDTPPTFSITTLNAMAASDYLLIPFQPEPLCLYGLSQLQESYEMVKNNIRPNFKLLGLFVTLYDARSRVHKGIEAKVREDWGELVFKTVIHRRLNMLDASLEGRALVSINSNSELALEYKALTEEVIFRVQ
jgi:chromosome partitioning protein